MEQEIEKLKQIENKAKIRRKMSVHKASTLLLSKDQISSLSKLPESTPIANKSSENLNSAIKRISKRGDDIDSDFQNLSGLKGNDRNQGFGQAISQIGITVGMSEKKRVEGMTQEEENTPKKTKGHVFHS
jgi:hypothetical protein